MKEEVKRRRFRGSLQNVLTPMLNNTTGRGDGVDCYDSLYWDTYGGRETHWASILKYFNVHLRFVESPIRDA